MSAASPSTFKAGLVQMRSGVDPQTNLATALAAIEEAKRAGAAYVLTPEMTNILESKRERLFAAITDEESDATLAALREAARRLSIYIHIGSLAVKASPDRAANRSFLIDPRGDVVARYDKIHMFDVDLANGESYRESRTYRAGELAVVTDLPWGARRSRRFVLFNPLRFHAANRRGALACADARARDREWLVRVRRCTRRQARERA
jgi:predicted amidohydrolase